MKSTNKKIVFLVVLIIAVFLSFAKVGNAVINFDRANYASNSNYELLCKYDHLRSDKGHIYISIYRVKNVSGKYAISYTKEGTEYGLEGTVSEINSNDAMKATKSFPNVEKNGCPGSAYIDFQAEQEICFSSSNEEIKNSVSVNCAVHSGGNTATNFENDFVSSTRITNNATGTDSGDGSNPIPSDFDGGDTCEGFLGDKSTPGTPANYLHLILSIMRYLAIILALGFSVIDFFKAVYSQDKDLLKKATMTAIKRVIYAVVIFFIPIILEFILSLLGAYTVHCV